MPTTTVRIDDLSRCMSAVSRSLPSRWEDAFGDWIALLRAPRHDAAHELDQRTLRDIGLLSGECAPVDCDSTWRSATTLGHS